MLIRKTMSYDDATRSDRWDRDGSAFWILYAVIGWTIAYVLYLSSSNAFQLGL